MDFLSIPMSAVGACEEALQNRFEAGSGKRGKGFVDLCSGDVLHKLFNPARPIGRLELFQNLAQRLPRLIASTAENPDKPTLAKLGPVIELLPGQTI
jgi:hypothetical protein